MPVCVVCPGQGQGVVVQGTWQEIVDKLQLGASMSMSWLNDQTKWGLALDDLRVPSKGCVGEGSCEV